MRIMRFIQLLLRDLVVFTLLLMILGSVAYVGSDFVRTLAIMSAFILVSGFLVYWIAARWKDSE